MKTEMQAVVYRGPGEVAVETVPVPPCGDDEIRVTIDACAVCGTDLKSYVHGNPKVKPPMVIGHEFTGTIENIGSNVNGTAIDEFAVGDRIVMATSVSCGECHYCKQGWTNLCVDLAAMGFRYPGGMAEYTIVPARALRNKHVITVPPRIKPEHAALAEPLSCAVNALRNCELAGGSTLVVVGAGPLGIMNAVVARLFGAAKIIMAETNETRLERAAAFGFERLVNPEKEDLARVVKDETGGIGADVVVVAAPAAGPQEDAVNLVRKRGTICLFASLPAGKSMHSIDSRPVHYNELRIVGTSDSTPDHVRQAVDLMDALPLEQLATHVLPLGAIAKAYELMQSGESLRVVLKP